MNEQADTSRHNHRADCYWLLFAVGLRERRRGQDGRNRAACGRLLLPRQKGAALK